MVGKQRGGSGTREWLAGADRRLTGDGSDQPDRRAPKRVVSGTFWLTLSRLSLFAIEAVRNIVMARLILPQAHGLFGLAVVASMLVRAFSNFGFEVALIRRRENVRDYFGTAWTITVGVGIGATAVLFFGAPLFTALVGQPAAIPVIQAYAFVLLVASLRNTALIELHRNLDFKRLFMIEVAGSLAGLVAGIAAAVTWHNVWALVIGMLVRTAISTLASFLFFPWWPVPGLDLEKARELFRFGRWMLAGGALHFLFNQADDLVVARLLGTTPLGLYRQAYGWSNLPANQITGVAATVTRPVFSQLQDRPAELVRALGQSLRVVSLLAFPILTAMVVLAPRLVGPVLGQAWIPMIPAFQVLALWGGMRALRATLAPMLQTLNRPDLDAWMMLGKVLLLAAMIYPLTVRWGILGTSVAVVASSVVELPVLLAVITRLLGTAGSLWALLREPLIFAACAALMAGAMILTLEAQITTLPLVAAALAGGVGILVFGVATAVADHTLGVGIRELLGRGSRGAPP